MKVIKTVTAYLSKPALSGSSKSMCGLRAANGPKQKQMQSPIQPEREGEE
jgi:hypothetical protein